MAVLAWTLWPLFVSLRLATLVALVLLLPGSLAVGALVSLFGLVILMVLCEQVLPYRHEWSLRGDTEIFRDVAHTLLAGGLGSRLAQILFVSSAAILAERAGVGGASGLWPGQLPMLAQILLVVVIGDALEYGYHRATHTWEWLWRLHAVHHSPVRLHALKAGRHHFLYFAMRGLFVWAPLIALGAPPALLVWQPIAISVFGPIGHANIAYRIPPFVDRLFMTPQFHRIHHSVDSRLGNSNYAVVFPIWDVLFGTYSDPRTTDLQVLGITDDPIPRSLGAELLSPLVWSRLVRRASEAAGDHS